MENLVNTPRLTDQFKGKKVFITGHTGFKGSWLTSVLSRLGAQIKGYALPPEFDEGLYRSIEHLGLVESIFADIRDRGRLAAEITSFQPDFIFHLAAQPLVRRSFEIPAETFEINVVGTANLLEVAGQLDKKCVMLVITTDKVYENKEQHILYTEEDRLGGYDPYSASKACTELVVDSFRRSFFNPSEIDIHKKVLASARAGNVIGGGDWSADRIVPDIVRALREHRPVEVRNPGSVRPWQHVMEPLLGYLQLAASMYEKPAAYSKAYNFGPYPEDHLEVRELVELAIQTWGAGSWKDVSGSSQPHEAGLLKLDIKRSLNEIPWRPMLRAPEAIRWTIEWYRKEKTERADFTFSQIDNYLSL